MATRVLVLVGTKKGGFILESDERRSQWTMRGPFCQAWPMYHMVYDGDSGLLFAGGGNEWFGPAVWRSTDLGETWSQSGEGLSYGDEGPGVQKVWHVRPAHGALFAGVAPAGLFRSDDNGLTWNHVAGLRDHPTRPTWEPGAGGLCLHSIVPHPSDADRMWVAISAVGTFFTADGGATWTPQNRGVRVVFGPELYPETGQCVHKLLMAPGKPDLLYQQNHCGVYRSADGGASWQEVTPGLPSEFGFPLAIHPHDPRTIYVIPLNGEGRFVPGGAVSVWRSKDGGDSWDELTEGLPRHDAYLGVLREAMAVDTLDRAGIYFGTGTGQIFGSADDGDTWRQIGDYLPPIYSVETAIIED